MSTVMGIFVQGEQGDIERVYYSFWNHMACSGDIEYWSDTCALFWIHGSGSAAKAHSKLAYAMNNMALAELQNTENIAKGSRPMLRKRAAEIAQSRLDSMDKVTWYAPPAADLSLYHMGDSVKAEKSTGDLSDVLVSCLERGKFERPDADPFDDSNLPPAEIS